MNQFKNKTVEEVWDELGDVPVNDDMELEESFLDYYIKGTDIEEHYNISVAKDLMFKK